MSKNKQKIIYKKVAKRFDILICQMYNTT